MKQSPSSKITQAAARPVLRPLALVQRGRSRTWLDDRGWFLIAVIFESHSYSQGSTLTVICCWLWDLKGYFKFDVGGREGVSAWYESDEQFAPLVSRQAMPATSSIEHYRRTFQTVRDVATYYDREASSDFWARFHWGIAQGLVGNLGRATELFDGVRRDGLAGKPEWMHEAAEQCRNCPLS